MKLSMVSSCFYKPFRENGMTMIDVIKVAKEIFDIDMVEMVHWMTYANTNPENVNTRENMDNIKEALNKYGVAVLNMCIDVGNISQLDKGKRREDIEKIKEWIDWAAYLGSRAARPHAGFQPEGMLDLNITVDSFKELCDYAGEKGLNVLMENFDGVASDPDNMIEIFERVNRPNFKIIADFDNFPAEIRYQGLDKIFDLDIHSVHVKTFEFDEQGEQIKYDFSKCIEIVKKHNYRGYMSVEYEGQGNSIEGIKKTIALLKKYM
ncbi:Sugar phosphate isomerase/epimerase [Caldanaerobius fijiensis DSM 17918]|uniref:Sugar phosphate isomerase/epimerase n=1 Tax=Caldanaerobius fijiensis DSM 17918 TaxID=1121256 RepID=A0A1M4SWM6_9THEO|nr:sugar phosphate isomerase/epimerase family protein [Caldanaerobius fijiensis]SHE36614.1 Sugar phosphate isomerase/epimerase [Caldanaerobius fijiensis DSM 17918]